MKIGIDASFLRKQNTGIGQVSANFLKKLAEFPISSFPARNALHIEAGGQFSNKQNEYFLYLEEDVKLELPANFHKRIFLPLWKRDDLVRKIWWEKYALPQKVKRDGCEVFLSLSQTTTVLPDKVKHLMVVHDIIPRLLPAYLNNWRKKLYWQLTERAMQSVSKIVAVSHRTEKDLVQHLDIAPSKITVTYVDVDEIYKKEVTAQESAQVLAKYNLKSGYIYHGGGLDVRKNTETLLRAYKILLEKSSTEIVPQLVISGKLMPNLKPLIVDVEALVEELELTGHVVLLDFVPQEDLPALYREALLFVYPSKYEGFGLPVLEAMNQGVPVVTSKKSSLPEIGSDSVLYCNPEEAEDLAMVMRNVLQNEKLRVALSLKGRERAKHFTWEKFVAKILHLIEN